MTELNRKKVIKMPQLTAENDNVEYHDEDYSYFHYLKVCLWDKFFCLKGRARRKEYITFQLFDLLVALSFYYAIHHLYLDNPSTYMAYDIISTILIVPLITVTVRRFHDAGFSGWWCLLGVIPFITIAFLAIKNSERSANKYGEVPTGKTFGAPLWTNYAFRKAYEGENVVKFKPTSTAKGKNKKKAA